MADLHDDEEDERGDRDEVHRDRQGRDRAATTGEVREGRREGGGVGDETLLTNQSANVLPHLPGFRNHQLHAQNQRRSFDPQRMRTAPPHARSAPSYSRPQVYPDPTHSLAATGHSFGQQFSQEHHMAGIQANYGGDLAVHGQPYHQHFQQHFQHPQSVFYHYGHAASAYYPMPPQVSRPSFNHSPGFVFGSIHGNASSSYGPVLPCGGGTMNTESSIPTLLQTGSSIGRHDVASSATPLALRGPPKKPKQSGHALWCGNLPAETTITELKDYFSRDATQDIESVFLISKSSCAFVNYKTEASCTAALTRFHDSRFRGSKLVCRLRKPSAISSAGTSNLSQPRPMSEMGDGLGLTAADIPGQTQPPQDSKDVHPTHEKTVEKFFVLKSLTVEDLDASVRTGSWATQSHNEAALNIAYRLADNVYLIFSANKSGEYYGCAKMASAIEDAIENADDSPPQPTSSLAMPTDSSVMTPTAATEHAPKGYVIDDSTRGTIFWEVDEDEILETQDAAEESATIDAAESDVGQQTLGRPFRIEWLSAQKVPFHRARGLRNPWNQNREVKIARDGTEIEPSVGRRLVHLFFNFDPHSSVNVATSTGGLSSHMLTSSIHPPMLPMAYQSDPRFARPQQ